ILVIICPTVNGRDLAGPVAVAGLDRRSPFERCGAPGIWIGHLPALPDGSEEVHDEEQLREEGDDDDYGDKLVQRYELPEAFPRAVVVVTARHTGHTFIVHRPEDEVSADERDPEVDVPERVVHEAAVHLGEPVIDTCEHAHEG